MSQMIFIFLCFSGLFVMFFFILRGQEKMHSSLHEELNETKTRLRMLEAQLSSLIGQDLMPEQQDAHNNSMTHASPDPLSSHNPLNMGPPESLSMGNEENQKHAGGLDLHFDPNEHMRR